MAKAWFKTEHPLSDHVLLQAYLGSSLLCSLGWGSNTVVQE